jgi:hypothetical protein
MQSMFSITVAARSKAWTVFAPANAGIVGSNTTQDMDICVCLFCVCIGRGLAKGWSPIQGVLPTVLGLRNWSETKRFTNALCSKVGATWKREKERTVYVGMHWNRSSVNSYAVFLHYALITFHRSVLINISFWKVSPFESVPDDRPFWLFCDVLWDRFSENARRPLPSLPPLLTLCYIISIVSRAPSDLLSMSQHCPVESG